MSEDEVHVSFLDLFQLVICFVEVVLNVRVGMPEVNKQS